MARRAKTHGGGPMSRRLSENAEAILLLTQPLRAGKRGSDNAEPLGASHYGNLAKRLHANGFKPADLLGSGVYDVLRKCGMEAYTEQFVRLLDRGFLLSLAMEQWRARAIWIVTRADQEYPMAFKQEYRLAAPPVVYGRGNKKLLKRGVLAIVGPEKPKNKELLRYSFDVAGLAAKSGFTTLACAMQGVGRAAMGGAMSAGGAAIAMLGSELGTAVLDPSFIPGFASQRLVICSTNDPANEPSVGSARAASRLAYVLSDAVLAVDARRGAGPVWRSINDQLRQQTGPAIYVRSDGDDSKGLESLRHKGAKVWPDPENELQFKQLMSQKSQHDHASPMPGLEIVEPDDNPVPPAEPRSTTHSVATGRRRRAKRQYRNPSATARPNTRPLRKTTLEDTPDEEETASGTGTDADASANPPPVQPKAADDSVKESADPEMTAEGKSDEKGRAKVGPDSKPIESDGLLYESTLFSDPSD